MYVFKMVGPSFLTSKIIYTWWSTYNPVDLRPVSQNRSWSYVDDQVYSRKKKSNFRICLMLAGPFIFVCIPLNQFAEALCYKPERSRV
jgi:hypothetical protein